LLGALYLKGLDQQFENRTNVFCIRYMDDILIMCKTHWKLKKAVRDMSQTFATLKLRQHPDKTFIGKVCKGFDFLDYHFTGTSLSLARKTVDKHVRHYKWLYEQLRKCCSPASMLLQHKAIHGQKKSHLRRDGFFLGFECHTMAAMGCCGHNND